MNGLLNYMLGRLEETNTEILVEMSEDVYGKRYRYFVIRDLGYDFDDMFEVYGSAVRKYESN